MNANDYVTMVGHTMRAQPTWRYGQACFNVLFQYRPERAEEIRGSALDPFYHDEQGGPFWDSFYAWLDTWMIV